MSVRPLRRAKTSSTAFHAHSTAAAPRNADSTLRVLANRRKECKAGETERERQRQKERPFFIRAAHGLFCPIH